MSLNGKRRKGKVMTPEQEGIFREKLKALSPAELEALRSMAQAAMMKAHKVTDVDGKKVGTPHVGKRVMRRNESPTDVVRMQAICKHVSLMARVDRLRVQLTTV